MAQSYRMKKTKRELKERPAWYAPVSDTLLHETTQRIVEECEPERIILFGSHAYGHPNWESDLDLLIITSHRAHESVFTRARKIYALFLDRASPMDILVRSPQEIAYRLKIGDMFFQDILEHGRVLYERANGSRVGAQSRRRLRKRSHPRAAAQKVSA